MLLLTLKSQQCAWRDKNWASAGRVDKFDSMDVAYGKEVNTLWWPVIFHALMEVQVLECSLKKAHLYFASLVTRHFISVPKLSLLYLVWLYWILVGTIRAIWNK